MQIVLSHADRVDPPPPTKAVADLESAAAPQLAWIRGVVTAHQAAHKRHMEQAAARALAAGRAAPKLSEPLKIRDHIACVCAADGGGESLQALRTNLNELVEADPPLLPAVNLTIPRSWTVAMALTLALRDGRDGLAAARYANAKAEEKAEAAKAKEREEAAAAAAACSSRGSAAALAVAAAAADPTAAATPAAAAPAAEAAAPPVAATGRAEADQSKKRAYILESALRATWLEEVVPALLPDEADPAAVLTQALQLLCDKGEIFTAAGLVFLDPAFATELLKPLTDHRMSRERERPAIEEHVRAIGADGDRLAAGKLLRAVDAHVKQGLLRHSVFAYHWRATALEPADYPRAISMLCESGVLFPLPSAGGEERWAMPMRLPADKPGELDDAWPAKTLAADATQLGLRFNFFGKAMPPGAIERIVAGCAASGDVEHCWRGGALIVGGDDGVADDARPRALVQSTQEGGSGTSWLEVEVRGPSQDMDALWRLLHTLRVMVDGVLGEYGGVQYEKQLLCPSCRQHGRWADASAWDLELDLGAKCTSKRCEKCRATIPLRDLLEPLPAAARRRRHRRRRRRQRRTRHQRNRQRWRPLRRRRLHARRWRVVRARSLPPS